MTIRYTEQEIADLLIAHAEESVKFTPFGSRCRIFDNPDGQGVIAEIQLLEDDTPFEDAK